MKKTLPKIIQDVGFDFDWDSEKVWALKYPAEEMQMKDLLWNFDKASMVLVVGLSVLLLLYRGIFNPFLNPFPDTFHTLPLL